MTDNNNNNQSAVTPADVQKHLSGLEYPASKQQVVDHATQNGASEDIISILDQLPDREYNGPAEVSREMGDIM
jgi:hypothetical protein